MTHDAIKQTMMLAGRVLVAEHQDDMTRGHISVRLPDNPSLFLMKPHSVGLDEITLDNILTINLDGEVVAGAARRHSEVFIHTEIYKARPDVQCVLHTHPPHAIALSATGRPLRAYSQPGALFRDAIGTFQESMTLVRSAAMGAGVARALGPHRAVLMKNHGVAIATASIAETVVSAVMLETAARIQMLVEATPERGTEFPAADIAALRDQLSKPDQFVVNFDYLVRRLTPNRNS